MFVANTKGYKLKEFRLDLFGASIELDNYVDERDSFLINLAGPLGNILMCLICLGLYYFIPISQKVLNNFCVCNLMLATFNLLPIYPLDGSKIFSSFFKSDKQKKIFNLFAKLMVVLISFLVFVITLIKGNFNFIPIVLIVFVLTTKSETKFQLGLFKNKDFNVVQSVEILRLSDDETILGAVKRIKKNRYTIFYVGNTKKFYDEDYMLALALKYDLSTKLCDVV